MHTRGIVLAGGKGTRLGALTRVTNKHLLPVGPEPMVYHPIRKLVNAGIDNIMLVTGTEHMGDFVSLLGSGKDLACDLTYRVQDEAGGIAQALGLCEAFCRGADQCVVLLGDNVFQMQLPVGNFSANKQHAHVMLKLVHDPERFGVAYMDGHVITKLVEKPRDIVGPAYATIGVYCYPGDVFEVIKTLKPSERGELEITDVNKWYLEQRRLTWVDCRGYWTDAGTLESLNTANDLVMNELAFRKR